MSHLNFSKALPVGSGRGLRRRCVAKETRGPHGQRASGVPRPAPPAQRRVWQMSVSDFGC